MKEELHRYKGKVSHKFVIPELFGEIIILISKISIDSHEKRDVKNYFLKKNINKYQNEKFLVLYANIREFTWKIE